MTGYKVIDISNLLELCLCGHQSFFFCLIWATIFRSVRIHLVFVQKTFSLAEDWTWGKSKDKYIKTIALTSCAI